MGIRACVSALVLSCVAFGQAPDANEIFSAIRDNDIAALRSQVKTVAVANVRGQREVTPLMYASAYGSVDAMKLLLKAGADVNAKNVFDATALMWSVTEPAKVKLLLDHGANPDAKAKDGRTALLIAAFSPGSDRAVNLLLSHGADPKAKAEDGTTFLVAASSGFNPREVRLAIEKGIDVNAHDIAGNTALMNAASNGDIESAKLLIAKGADVNAVSADAGPLKVKNGVIRLGLFTPLMLASTYGPSELVEMLIRAGARVDATDTRGMTALTYAVTSDRQSPEIVRALLKAGADPKIAMTPEGSTGDIGVWAAKFAVPGTLKQFSRVESAPVEAISAPERSTREATAQASALLARVSARFLETGGCIACHAQSISGMALAIAQRHGIETDKKLVDKKLIDDTFAALKWRWQSQSDALLAREDPPGGIDEEVYDLLPLAVTGYKNPVTDAVLVNIMSQQMPDGGWHNGVFSRSPMEDSDITRTALALYAMQQLGWEGRRADIAARIERAHKWLLRAKPVTNEDTAMRVLGLKWAGDPAADGAARDLAAQQREDGGWPQSSNLASDAYATGQALYALVESGAFHPGDTVIQRGISYLLKTQYEDGSWQVRSRSPKFQPYFQSGFPHGHDQWISMAGTAWAAIALAECGEAVHTASMR